jgi:MFS family permease
MILALTHLPTGRIFVAAPVTALLMATNSGRMVTAMSLITSSIEPRRRGSSMSANSAVQHVASGVGATLGGMIVEGGAGEPLQNFGTVGILAASSLARLEDFVPPPTNRRPARGGLVGDPHQGHGPAVKQAKGCLPRITCSGRRKVGPRGAYLRPTTRRSPPSSRESAEPGCG